jgi:hypothetical protein
MHSHEHKQVLSSPKGMSGGHVYNLCWGFSRVGLALGPIVGMTMVLFFLNKSKMDEISCVGSGVTVTWGVCVAVGVTDGILVGIVMREDEPERWLEISSLALMARTGAHTIARTKKNAIK